MTRKKTLKHKIRNRLTRKNRTPLIKLYDKVDLILGKGLLLASAPVLVPTDTLLTALIEKKNPKRAFDKVSRELKRRLNKGMGRGRHFAGVNL